MTRSVCTEGTHMPFINGRFYMNPAYGRSLERSRAAKEDRKPSISKRRDLVAHSPQSDSPPFDSKETEIPLAKDGGLEGTSASDLISAHLALGGHWVTIDGRHVLIQGTQRGRAQINQPLNELERYLAIVIFNETGGLSASTKNGNGSAGDLQDARLAVAEVAKRLRENGHPEQVAPAEGGIYTGLWYGLSQGNADAIDAWNDSVSAARTALLGSNITNSATHFRLDSKSGAVPAWAKGRVPSQTFGPFRNAGGGDASSRPRIYVYR